MIIFFIGAVRRNKLLSNHKITRSEVENAVKLWLRYANERCGGGGRRLRVNDSDTD